MKKLAMSFMGIVAALLVGCGGGGTGGSETPCASEDDVSLAMLGSSLTGHGMTALASATSGQVVIFSDAKFQLQAGQKVAIQANVSVPASCRQGLRFSWARTGTNGETRRDPAWLDVDPVTGLVSGTVPADLTNGYDTGGSMVVVEMRGVKWRFLNFSIAVSP